MSTHIQKKQNTKHLLFFIITLANLILCFLISTIKADALMPTNNAKKALKYTKSVCTTEYSSKVEEHVIHNLEKIVNAEIPTNEEIQEIIKEESELPITEDELELLARVVHAEAGNQDMVGKRLVVDVVLNRIDHPLFTSSTNINSTIYAEGQFSTAKILFNTNNTPTESDYEAVKKELYERLDYDIVYFRTDYYHSCGVPAYIHGAHYFSNSPIPDDCN